MYVILLQLHTRAKIDKIKYYFNDNNTVWPAFYRKIKGNVNITHINKIVIILTKSFTA